VLFVLPAAQADINLLDRMTAAGNTRADLKCSQEVR